MSFGRPLSRGSPGSRSDRKPYAVLDVETDGLRGDLLYWSAACECDPERMRHGTTAAELWWWITDGGPRHDRSREHIWWGHNAGEYDYVYLLMCSLDRS